MSTEIPLLLFAKAPVAGEVKTRLHSHCSPQQAADIAAILIRQSIHNATAHWPGPVYLCVWPDDRHPLFAEMRRRFSVGIAQQCPGDLGQKMQHALQSHGYPAAVMGCDAPHIDPADLKQAHTCLTQGRSVIGPSLDGGYYLLGLTHAAPRLFRRMPWGTESVLELTLKEAASTELSLTPLSALQDVDEWSDLWHAARQVQELADYLHTHRLT